MAKAKKKTVSPRDQWVYDAPDGYVLRRWVSGEWKETHRITHAEVILAAAVLEKHAEVMIYAVRDNPESAETHIALVTREELLGANDE